MKPYNTDQGVILIAAGHTEYGKLAYCNALSIRYKSDIPIILFADNEAIRLLQPAHRSVFTDIVDISSKIVEQNYFQIKTMVYDLSPFEKTLYVDADVLWFYKRPINDLFQELNDASFTMISEGYVDIATGASTVKKYTHWAQLDDIKESYQGKMGFDESKLYQMRSELIYFIKSKENKKYFDLVKKIYADPKVKYTSISKKVPDELAFNIASALLHHYPHSDNFCPIYWWFQHGRSPNLSKLFHQYYGYSIGGNHLPLKELDDVNSLVKFYSREKGVLPFTIKNKKDYIKERKFL